MSQQDGQELRQWAHGYTEGRRACLLGAQCQPPRHYSENEARGFVDGWTDENEVPR